MPLLAEQFAKIEAMEAQLDAFKAGVEGQFTTTLTKIETFGDGAQAEIASVLPRAEQTKVKAETDLDGVVARANDIVPPDPGNQG